MHHRSTSALVALLNLMLLVAGIALAPAVGAASPDQSAFVVQPEAGQPRDEIQRGYFTLTAEPGDTRSLRLVVKNTGDEPLTVLCYPVDGYQVHDSGVDYTIREKPLTGTGRWLSVDPPRLTLAPGEAQRITATIQVPDSLPPGEYVGGIAVENERVQSHGSGSNVMIDLHYRNVVAAVVTVPGPRVTSLEVGMVELAPEQQGSRARIELRNRGNILLKGKGTIEIGGVQASSGALPFSVGSILPTEQARVLVDLPHLSLKPGSYDVRVQVTSQDLGPLASWQGQVLLSAPRAPDTAGPSREIQLDPLQQPASAGQDAAEEQPTWPGLLPLPLAAALAGAAIVLGFAIGVFRLVRSRDREF